MGAIDMSIINVALPSIRSTLGVTLTEVSWVATGYLVAVVVILPLTSWLASVVGRKNLYLVAVVLFTAASFCCGLSHTLGVLLFFRILQGIGAGLMQPIAMAVLREVFPPAQQAMAMGIFGIAILLGPAIGPTLGGWLTDNYGWPWIFFINVPIGAVTMLMAAQFLYDPSYLRRQRLKDVDLAGIALLAIGLGSLQIVLSEGQSRDWFNSIVITGLTTVAGAGVIAFVVRELRARNPAVDLTILANPTFTSGTILGGLLGLSLFGTIFLLPLFMQELLRYDAFQSGLAMLPRSVVMMIGMPIAGRLYNRVGPRLMIGSGLGLSVLASLQMALFTDQTDYLGLMIPQVWQGVSFSLIFVSLSTAALARVARARMTNAAALYNLVRQVGGSFGIAIFATMLERQQTTVSARLLGYLNPYNVAFLARHSALTSGLAARGVAPAETGAKALALLEGMVQQQAGVMAFEHTFFVIGALFVVTLPLIFLLPPRREAVPETHA